MNRNKLKKYGIVAAFAYLLLDRLAILDLLRAADGRNKNDKAAIDNLIADNNKLEAKLADLTKE